MTGDVQFELEAAAALRRRDPGPMPRSLVDRVAAIPADHGTGLVPSFVSRFIPVARLGLGAAVLVLAVVAVVSLRPTVRLGPSESGGPIDLTFDPAREGPGIVTAATGLGPLLLVVGGIAVGALLAGRGRRNAIRGTGIVLMVVSIVAPMLLASYDAVAWRGGGWAQGLGYVGDFPIHEGPVVFPDDHRTAVFAPGPGGRVSFGFDVTNQSPVPVTILGIAPTSEGMAWGHVTSLGLLRDPSLYSVEPEALRTFAPVRVPPDGQVFLLVVGEATPCAIGPPVDVATQNAYGVVGSIDVVYEILGVQRQTRIETPVIASIATDDACMTPEVTPPPP